MPKIRSFIIVIFVVLLFALPSSVLATTNKTFPDETGVYGICSDGTWLIDIDFTETNGGFSKWHYGGWYLGDGWQPEWYFGNSSAAELTSGGFSMTGVDVRWVEVMTTPGVTVADMQLGVDSETYSSGEYGGGLLRHEWPSGTVFTNQVSIYSWMAFDDPYFITSYSLGGEYTGDCPAAGFAPPVDVHYKPLLDSETYEVIHIADAGPIADTLHTDDGANVYNSYDGQVVAIETGGAGYLVKVLAADDSYTLYYNLETVYPNLNDTITGGCVLGTAGKSFQDPPGGPYTQDPGLLWYYPGTDFYDFDQNAYIDWQTEFSPPPTSAVPCGSELRTTNCLNYNPALSEEARGWTVLNVDEYNLGDDQVKLQEYQSSIAQYLVLDDTLDYYVTLKTHQWSESDDYISVVLSTATDFEILDTETFETQTEILGQDLITEVGPLTFTTSDVNDMYILSVMASNSHTHGVWVDDICIHDGSANVGVPYCYFTNESFDQGETDWDSSETDVVWHPIGANNPLLGAVVLNPGGWISQPVSLYSYDDADADYVLSFDARVAYTQEFDDLFTALSADTTQTIDVTEIGAVTVNNVLIPRKQEVDFTVTNGNSLIGDFVFENDALSVSDIEISHICIRPAAGYWPGEEPDIDTDPGEEPNICNACLLPTGLSIAEWITYLWCQLMTFFTCTLLPWLGWLGGLVNRIGDFIGLFGRYIGLVVTRVSAWLISLLEALGIALWSALLYVLSLAWNMIAGLSIATMLYDLIGYLTLLVTGFIGLLTSGLGLILSFFDMLLTLGNLMQAFVASLSNALSGDVTTIVVPSCDAPSSPLLSGFCVVFEIADGIYTEFPALSTSMLLNAGLIGFVTIVWTIREFGEAFGNVA